MLRSKGNDRVEHRNNSYHHSLPPLVLHGPLSDRPCLMTIGNRNHRIVSLHFLSRTSSPKPQTALLQHPFPSLPPLELGAV